MLLQPSNLAKISFVQRVVGELRTTLQGVDFTYNHLQHLPRSTIFFSHYWVLTQLPQALHQELCYCVHLSLPAVLVQLKSYNCVNLAQHINTSITDTHVQQVGRTSCPINRDVIHFSLEWSKIWVLRTSQWWVEADVLPLSCRDLFDEPGHKRSVNDLVQDLILVHLLPKVLL